VPTAEYEACLARGEELRSTYETCLAGSIPDFDLSREWFVNDRECAGGGGQCGPPEFVGPLQEGLPASRYGFSPFHPENFTGWTGPEPGGAFAASSSTWQRTNYTLYALEAYEPDITRITPDNGPTAPYHTTRVPTYYGTARNLTGRGPLASGWQPGATWGYGAGAPFKGLGFERRVAESKGGGEESSGERENDVALALSHQLGTAAALDSVKGKEGGRLSELEAAASLGSSSDEPLTEQEKLLQKAWRGM